MAKVLVPANCPSLAPPWLTAKPIAHRGLHRKSDGIIENSKSAFLAAVGGGYAIECDVQLTGDGEAVVFHDYTLDRLTSAYGTVASRKTSELQKLGIEGSLHKDCINTLVEMLDQVAGKVPIVVEIKSRFDGDLRLTRRVVEVLEGRDMPIAIKSFDPQIVTALRMLIPDRPRGIVAMAQYDYGDYASLSADEKRAMANLLHYSDMQPDFISWHVKDLPHAAPHLCRDALGLPVMTWTVRTPDDVAQASRYADQIVFEGFLP